ncbi:alpha/beta hydrolase [Microbacterium sp. RD1]|uniref:alpha/beta hydrolase n=1 Tax=Microbacterium sp. RD1 TaxID=3457313 RepID=UPI003FA56D66
MSSAITVRSELLELVEPPATVRGTVLLLPGRGDDPSYYRRLAARLAVDGYASRVAPAPVESAADVAALWEADPDAEGVRLVVGVDTSAGFLAAALAGGAVAPSGAVFAGTAVPAGVVPEAGEELAARSACPIHRGVVERADAAPLAASTIIPTWPEDAASVPVLAIHGGADTIAPLESVSPLYDGWRADVVTVTGGLHDVLNDVHHRSVSAEIVAFLERLRLDADAAPILVKVRTR